MTLLNRLVLTALVVAFLGALPGADPTAAAAPDRTWRAPVGNGWPTQMAGSNGTAAIERYWTGSGTLGLELKNLVRGAVYGVTLFKGPYVAPGSSWSSRGRVCEDLSDGPVVRLPAIRTTAAGTIDRTIALSASQMTAISAIPRKIAITVGSGRYARCAGFELLAKVTPSPSPPPSPGSGGEAIPAPTCSAWPQSVVDIVAVLSVPDGMCLLRYPSLAAAPEFMDGLDGLYFARPPTIHYVDGGAGRETPVLAHEVCHAHQDRVTRDENLGEFVGGWYRTAAGIDYLETTGWRRQGDRWIEGSASLSKRPEAVSSATSPLEDNAGTCALWFDPALGPHFLRRWAPTRFAWAQRWLPLPSFIVPNPPG